MKPILYFLLTFCICLNTEAQDKKPTYFIKAELFFKNKDYYHALKFYQLSLSKKSKKLIKYHNSALAGCAASLKQMNVNDISEKYYKQYIKSIKKTDSNTFHLALVLKKNEKYKEAKEYFIKYQQQFPLTPNIEKHISSCDSALIWLKSPSTFRVSNLSKINTTYSEISPVKYKEDLVYASNFEGMIIKKKKQFNTPYYDFYIALMDSNGNIENKRPFSMIINTIHHEASASFSKDFKKIYFTRSHSRQSNRFSVENKNKLKLFTSEESNGAWKNSKLFVFNDSTYSFAHPSIDKDEKLFFFASDMPGGFGGTDIYVSLNINGKWTNPINLGSKVNTPGNEIYPFYQESGELYFTSDFHEGLGGYDIFKAIQSEGDWTKVINLRSPINSSADDFSIYLNEDYSLGYFSSNRKGGKGSEDIYKITKINK